MEIHKIDIDSVNESTYYDTHQTIARRIITRIIRANNEVSIKNGKLCNNILVSFLISEYLYDSPGFYMTTPNSINHIGSIAGLTVYVDTTSTLKDNEIFLFNDISELNFIKKISRAKKLERILCQD